MIACGRSLCESPTWLCESLPAHGPVIISTQLYVVGTTGGQSSQKTLEVQINSTMQLIISLRLYFEMLQQFHSTFGGGVHVSESFSNGFRLASFCVVMNCWNWWAAVWMRELFSPWWNQKPSLKSEIRAAVGGSTILPKSLWLWPRGSAHLLPVIFHVKLLVAHLHQQSPFPD